MVTTAIYLLGSTLGALRCSLCQVVCTDSRRGTQRSGFPPRFLLGRSGYFLHVSLTSWRGCVGFLHTLVPSGSNTRESQQRQKAGKLLPYRRYCDSRDHILSLTPHF